MDDIRISHNDSGTLGYISPIVEEKNDLAIEILHNNIEDLFLLIKVLSDRISKLEAKQ